MAPLVIRRVVCAGFLVGWLCSLSYAVGKPRITPLRTSFTFSDNSALSQRSVPIKSTDGHTIYVLSLEPDFDVRHRVVTLEVVLRLAHDKGAAQNLLAPTGVWHGYQAYVFAGSDFALGPDKSAFGPRRTISVQRLGLVVRIVVSGVKVSPITGTPGLDYQLDALDLQIEVDNVADNSR
jgi:hypothetical protein